VPSRGVHMIGMVLPIDVLFLDCQKSIVAMEESLQPFRISGIHQEARTALELPVHTIRWTGTRVGDRLEIAPVA
jgi:uncharacterized membrane protein (UPF0127 family)